MSSYCYINFYVSEKQKHEVCDFVKMLVASEFSDVPITIGELKQLPPVSPSDELLEFTSKITDMGVKDTWIQNIETCYQILQRITERFQTTIGTVWADIYIEKTIDSYHEYVRSIILNPSRLGEGIVLEGIHNSVRCANDESDDYAFVHLVLNSPKKTEQILVVIAENVNKNGTGINHPFNTLDHLVDLKTQLEVHFKLDGVIDKHVRTILVSKNIGDKRFMDRLLRENIEYLKIS